MAGELVVADNQYQLRDLLIGGTGKYQWEDVAPNWWGTAPMRTNDTPYAAAHGVRGGRDLLGSKPIMGRLLVLADDGPDLQGLLDALAAAWAPSDEDLPFVAQQLGQKRRRYGRPRRLEVIPDHVILGKTAIVAVEFEALDPLVYSDTEYTVVTSRASTGSGFTPPFTPPFTLGSSSGGTVTADNAGTMPAPWTARLDGPLTNPSLTHQQTGMLLDLSANGGLELAAGEFALLDSADRSVLVNGTADRRVNLRLPYAWFDLDVGINTIAFAADGGTGTLTFNWRDTYL